MMPSANTPLFYGSNAVVPSGGVWSEDAIRRGATARDRTSKSDFYLTSNAEQVIYRSEPNGGH